MPVITEDEDGIQTIHTAYRLQSEVGEANEQVEDMTLEIYFKTQTQLPNGRIIGESAWDTKPPLKLNCKDDPELAEAMRVIQRKIGQGRYTQITAPTPDAETSFDIIPPAT